MSFEGKNEDTRIALVTAKLASTRGITSIPLHDLKLLTGS